MADVRENLTMSKGPFVDPRSEFVAHLELQQVRLDRMASQQFTPGYDPYNSADRLTWGRPIMVVFDLEDCDPLEVGPMPPEMVEAIWPIK